MRVQAFPDASHSGSAGPHVDLRDRGLHPKQGPEHRGHQRRRKADGKIRQRRKPLQHRHQRSDHDRQHTNAQRTDEGAPIDYLRRRIAGMGLALKEIKRFRSDGGGVRHKFSFWILDDFGEGRSIHPKSFITDASCLVLIPRIEQLEQVGQGLLLLGLSGDVHEVAHHAQ